MSLTAAKPAIRDVAEQLWKENVEAEPNIEAVYIFPSDEEIRLVHLDSSTFPSNDTTTFHPWYFGAKPIYGIPYPVAIALIRPEEKATLRPPAEWGDWKDAREVWKK